MKRTLIAFVVACLLFSNPVFAQRILNADTSPAEQGWETYSTLQHVVVANGSAIRINTWYPDNPYSPELMFYRNFDLSAINGFNIKTSLRVHRATYNSYDGGVVLMGAYTQPFITSTPRAEMLIFAEDRITWGDLSDTYYMDTKSQFHTYELRVKNARAQVFVDGILALQRFNYSSNGTIAFGDQSNDYAQTPNQVNGDFSIQYLDLTIIPEPGTILLISLGSLLIRKRK